MLCVSLTRILFIMTFFINKRSAIFFLGEVFVGLEMGDPGCILGYCMSRLKGPLCHALRDPRPSVSAC